MAAGIVESANATLRIANDDDRIRADLHGHIGTGLRQLAIMADKQPVLVENILQIQLVIFWIGVEFLLQAEIGVAPGQQPQHFVANVHSLEPLLSILDLPSAVLPATMARSGVPFVFRKHGLSRYLNGLLTSPEVCELASVIPIQSLNYSKRALGCDMVFA